MRFEFPSNSVFPLSIATFMLLFSGCFFGSHKSEESPKRFLFHYVCDTGDEMNTIEGYIVKDLVLDGKKRTTFRISPTDSTKLWTKLEEIHFFEMKSPYPSRPWVGEKPITWPNSLRVVFDDQEKYIEWDAIYGTRNPYKNLYELRELLRSIMQESLEWKSLPQARLPRL